MKIHLILLIAILASGCSLIPPSYDNNEYLQFAKLETHARFLHTECSDPVKVRARLNEMHFEVEVLTSYSFYLPRNSDIFEVTKILTQDVKEMSKRYDDGNAPSSMYCKLKSKTITTKARRALVSVGKLIQE